MALTEQYPDYLLGEAVSPTVLIGPRTRVSVTDSPNPTIAAGATIVGSMFTGRTASNPAFSTTGPDIQLGPDEGLIIEELSFGIQSGGATGKLQINNLTVNDPFGVLPLASLGASLPYTFGKVNADSFGWSVPKTSRGWYIRATADMPGSLTLALSTSYLLTNLDTVAATSYFRFLTMVYRKIQGLDPLVPKYLTEFQPT
jgi:hypothetical protein